MKAKNKAVLISDVHFNHNTIDLATKALTMAFEKASELKIPLIIAGDLNDTKAIIRGEVLNRILEVFSVYSKVDTYVIVGNHDRISEKAPAHTLNFLHQFRHISLIDKCEYIEEVGAWLMPYYHDVTELRQDLATIPEGSTIVMHQGVMGADMGEYVVDKSSIEPGAFAKFRVISGHYHRAQTINTDGKKHASYHEVGTFNYIGTPYSITHAEAHDGPKGIRLLTDTGLDFLACGLRKHVKLTLRHDEVMLPRDKDCEPNDILWLQVKGPQSELDKLSKKELGMKFIGHQNFNLDKIPDESVLDITEESKTFTDEELLDKIIDDSEETKDGKTYLKTLWREII